MRFVFHRYSVRVKARKPGQNKVRGQEQHTQKKFTVKRKRGESVDECCGPETDFGAKCHKIGIKVCAKWRSLIKWHRRLKVLRLLNAQHDSLDCLCFVKRFFAFDGWMCLARENHFCGASKIELFAWDGGAHSPSVRHNNNWHFIWTLRCDDATRCEHCLR